MRRTVMSDVGSSVVKMNQPEPYVGAAVVDESIGDCLYRVRELRGNRAVLVSLEASSGGHLNRPLAGIRVLPNQSRYAHLPSYATNHRIAYWRRALEEYVGGES